MSAFLDGVVVVLQMLGLAAYALVAYAALLTRTVSGLALSTVMVVGGVAAAFWYAGMLSEPHIQRYLGAAVTLCVLALCTFGYARHRGLA